MAKIKFKKPDRFDAIRAEKGVEHTIIHQSGHNYGTFKTSLHDVNTKLTQVALERFNREHGDDEDAKGKHAGIYAFVMTCVHDWRGIEDEDGKPVPFSKQNAFDYLVDGIEDDAWLSEELIRRSSDDRFYQKVGDPRATKKEAAGN